MCFWVASKSKVSSGLNCVVTAGKTPRQCGLFSVFSQSNGSVFLSATLSVLPTRIAHEIFPVNGVGMTTARDHVVIDYEEEQLLERARLFRDSTDSDAELCRQLNIPQKKGWNIPNARRLIRKETNLHQHIKPVLYRPFDKRLIFYHDSLIWRTVKQVMLHMLSGKNVGFLTTRQTRDQWDVFATRDLVAHKS